MHRLLLALSLALCFHFLLITFTLPDNTTLPPRLMGEEAIRISLSPIVNAESETEISEPEQSEKQEQISREPEESNTPAPIQVVEETVLRQELKKDPPAVLKAQAVVKTIHHKSLTSEAPATHPAQTDKNITPPAVPATIKASPLYAKNPKPNYPALARRRNWQGTVILSVFVSKKGVADRIKIHKSSGHTLLDKSALKTVASWKFIPGMETGHPVTMEVLIPVHFKLR